LEVKAEKLAVVFSHDSSDCILIENEVKIFFAIYGISPELARESRIVQGFPMWSFLGGGSGGLGGRQFLFDGVHLFDVHYAENE